MAVGEPRAGGSGAAAEARRRHSTVKPRRTPVCATDYKRPKCGSRWMRRWPWPAMARAAETAAHIASDSRAVPPQPVATAAVDRRYGESTIGGLTSLAASWQTQRAQFRAQQLGHDLSRREDLLTSP